MWTRSARLETRAVPARSMKEDDPLEDFARREITLDGVAKRVYVAGNGPAVIVMSEMPGISPHVARFSRGSGTQASRSTCPRQSRWFARATGIMSRPSKIAGTNGHSALTSSARWRRNAFPAGTSLEAPGAWYNRKAKTPGPARQNWASVPDGERARPDTAPPSNRSAGTQPVWGRARPARCL